MNGSEFDVNGYLEALAFSRNLYNDLLIVIEEGIAPLNKIVEAKKLTDGGFYAFVNRLVATTNNEEGNK